MWTWVLMGLAGVDTAVGQDGFIDVESAAHANHQGATVLWAGRVVARNNRDGETCIEVATLPLDASDGKPNAARQTGVQQAHFYACGDSLSQSDVTTGTLVAVAGTLGPRRSDVRPAMPAWRRRDRWRTGGGTSTHASCKCRSWPSPTCGPGKTRNRGVSLRSCSRCIRSTDAGPPGSIGVKAPADGPESFRL